jgi:hypothetical protein
MGLFLAKEKFTEFNLLHNASKKEASDGIVHLPGSSRGDAGNPAPGAYYSPIRQIAQG